MRTENVIYKKIQMLTKLTQKNYYLFFTFLKQDVAKFSVTKRKLTLCNAAKLSFSLNRQKFQANPDGYN
ncbi:hypothetical protein BpHYR1_012263 [Brachionus plicatilis]|uniref:Uncharacterized protein n=1 Tax=Brachionus plicatilis TaxID=10195 RepID=A0A3M7S987_BRAPC|nr:hypothetical protein BpHYR1_012263 [Brachionus plicatilis]